MVQMCIRDRPSNLLLTRIGARRTISRIMVLWGLTSASMLFVQGEWSFYVLRFMLGVFEAGFALSLIHICSGAGSSPSFS